MKDPKHLSISQLNKFQDCPRQHYYQYVLGYEAPSTTSQDYGKKCHEELEKYLKGEITEFPDTYHGRTCKNALPLLPAPKSGEVEKGFELHLEGVPVPVIGYMDYCTTEPVDGKVFLLDHKIVKSDQYLLTPEKLATTNQVVTYSKYLLDTCNADVVEASYLYIKRGGGFAKKVTVELSRDQVEETFSTIADGFRQLTKNYFISKDDTDTVPQVLASCDKWGGCPFRDECWGNRTGEQKNMATPFSLASLMQSLKTETPAQQAPVQQAPVQQAPAQQANLLSQISGKTSAPPPAGFKSLFGADTQKAPAAVIPMSIGTPAPTPTPVEKIELPSVVEDDVVDSEDEAVIEEGDENIFETVASAKDQTKVLFSTDSETLTPDWDSIELSINSPEYDALALVDDDVTEANAEKSLPDVAQEQSLNSIVEEDISTQSQQTTDVVLSWDWLDAHINDLTQILARTRKALLGSGNKTLSQFFAIQPNPEFWSVLTGVKNFGPTAVKDVKSFVESMIAGKTFNSYRDLQALGAPDLTHKVSFISENEQGDLFTMSNTDDASNVEVFPTIKQGLEIAKAVIEAVPVEASAPAATSAPQSTVTNASVSVTPAKTETQQTPTQKSNMGFDFSRLLLLGALPIKGIEMNVLDDLLAPLEDTIAESSSQPHISMVNFSKGYDQLAATVKLLLAEGKFDWSKPIYVSQQAQITYAKTVTVLLQNATAVLKNA